MTKVLKEKMVNLEFFTQQKYLLKNKGKINKHTLRQTKVKDSIVSSPR